MKIKIHSSELNRMMKTLSRCINGRQQAYGNIEIIYDNGLLAMRGTNGMFSAVMTTPVLGGDGETICVDGETFGKVCALGKGDMEITTDGRTCTIKGAGRTRIPIVKANVPSFKRIAKGSRTVIKAQDFQKAFSGVEHAISTDESRIALTGVNMEIGQYSLRMVTLDGFRMAVEGAVCNGDDFKMLVPGTFMRLIKDSVVAGDEIKLTSDGHRVQAETEGMLIACPLLNGEFPDTARLIPKSFKTECMVNGDAMRIALKNSAVVCSSTKLVKFSVEEDVLTISGNNEQADYEAEISSETRGDDIRIAFNMKYILDCIGSISTEDVVLQFSSQTGPCVAHGKDETGLRLVLPVRVVE